MGLSRSRLLSLTIRAAIGSGLACLIACGMASESTLADRSTGPDNEATDGGGSQSPSTGADASPGAPTGSGVVLVHAARFPSLRLCFENYPDLRPLPDATIMPEANRVGLEVGSVVRLPPFATAPGKVYVIDRIRASATTGENEKTCRERIECADGQTTNCCPKNTPGCLRRGADFLEAGAISDPLGNGRVDVLAITGCSNQIIDPGTGALECDTKDVKWDALRGNLLQKHFSLFPNAAATNDKLPVQLVHLSSQIDTYRAGGALDVTFGKLSNGGAKLEQSVAEGPVLFEPAKQATLTVKQDETAFFGENGFRITIGGNPAITIDQSLADVQNLSSPSDLPTTYYQAASNYALLLLGDPRVSVDGGTPDERTSVHLLAIPIVEPTSADAGADSGSTDLPLGDGG